MSRQRASVPIPEHGYPHREHRSKKGRTYAPQRQYFIDKELRQSKKKDKYLKKDLLP